MTDPIPVPILDMGFPLGATEVTTWVVGDTDRGRIGSAPLGSSASTFTEIDLSRLVSFSVQRGTQSVTSSVIRYDAGTATVVLTDPNGEFDPDNLDGPHVGADGQTQVTPMVPIRLRVVYGDTTYPIFYGYADEWSVVYVSPTEAGVQVRATDAFKVLQDPRARVGPIAATGAGELSGDRVVRILDAVGWPSAMRIVEAGDAKMAATTFDGSALDEILNVTDAELGQFYVGPKGVIRFKGRSAIRTATRSTTSAGTFGSDMAGGEMPYKDRTLDYGEARIVNDVVAKAAGPGDLATEQVKDDEVSKQRYRVKSLTRDDLVLYDDAAALMWAGLIVYQSKDLEQWIATLDIDPRAQPDTLYPQVLNRDLGDRITVVRRRGGANAVTRDSFIRGIEHTYGPGPNRWLTKWTLQAATKYTFFTIGDPSRGTIGTYGLA